MILLPLTALAKPPAPTLYAWVQGDQLALAVTVKRFDPRWTYRIALERGGLPAGQVRCRRTDTTLRCRFEQAGEHCASCGSVLDIPWNAEATAPGIRAFAGQQTLAGTDGLVVSMATDRLGGEGLLTATATVEHVSWLPGVDR